MKKLVILLVWQWILIAIVLVVVLSLGNVEFGITGFAVSADENTSIFAPPYDAQTGRQILFLEHSQIDQNTFEVTAEINHDMIYNNIYYYTQQGWILLAISDQEWNSASTSALITDEYTSIELLDGDDLFVAVWTCKAWDGEWKCGCKTQDDCGHWLVQGIDLEAPAGEVLPCVDEDGDGFGTSGTCEYAELDCNDTMADVNPLAIEIPYNGADDDCNVTTLDDDIDQDGFLIATDCDDASANIYPGGEEICGDGVDQDCSGIDSLCAQCGEGSVPLTGCQCNGNDFYTGYCCDNSYSLFTCGTPEVIFYDGFESGTANTWDYLNPYSAVNGDNPYQGEYSLNLQYTQGSQDLNYNQYALTDLPETREVYVKWYQSFEPDFIQPVESVIISSVGSDSWEVDMFTRRWQGSSSLGKLWLKKDGNDIDTGKILSNSQWYCMEMQVFSNTQGVDNGILNVWVDGETVYTQEGISLSDGSKINYYQQGGYYTGGFSSPTIHSYIDGVIISTERIGC